MKYILILSFIVIVGCDRDRSEPKGCSTTEAPKKQYYSNLSISAALDSHLPFKREGWKEYRDPDSKNKKDFEFSKADLQATDWVVLGKSKSLDAREFEKLYWKSFSDWGILCERANPQYGFDGPKFKDHPRFKKEGYCDQKFRENLLSVLRKKLFYDED
jgi:hypothetical protein